MTAQPSIAADLAMHVPLTDRYQSTFALKVADYTGRRFPRASQAGELIAGFAERHDVSAKDVWACLACDVALDTFPGAILLLDGTHFENGSGAFRASARIYEEFAPDEQAAIYDEVERQFLKDVETARIIQARAEALHAELAAIDAGKHDPNWKAGLQASLDRAIAALDREIERLPKQARQA